jgi:hypothetical protein
MAEPREHYLAVLRDLDLRKQRLKIEIEDLDRAIAVVRQAMPGESQIPLGITTPSNVQAGTISKPNAFLGISVRWAILWLLGDIADKPLTTAQIADELRIGGITSTASKFNSNVSAVLSVAKNKGEVRQLDDSTWELTDVGRSAWNHIKATRNLGSHKNEEAQQEP